MYLVEKAEKKKGIIKVLWFCNIQNVDVSTVGRVEVLGTNFEEAVADKDYCIVKIFNKDGQIIKEVTADGY